MNMVWTTEAPELKVQTDTRIKLDENVEKLVAFDDDSENENETRNAIATKKHHHDILLQQMRFPSSLSVINRSTSAPITESDHRAAFPDNNKTAELISQLLQSTDYLLLKPPNGNLMSLTGPSKHQSKLNKPTATQANTRYPNQYPIPAHNHANPQPILMESQDKDINEYDPLKKSTTLYLPNQGNNKNRGGHQLSNANILPSIAS